MTNEEMARGLLRRARAILQEAERLSEAREWSLAVRRSQETVELALKGALRAAGVETPKIHDVSDTLRNNAERLPIILRAELDLLTSTSRRLREARELAFYGDEAAGTAAEDLFSEDDAAGAVAAARRIVDLCIRALEA